MAKQRLNKQSARKKRVELNRAFEIVKAVFEKVLRSDRVPLKLLGLRFYENREERRPVLTRAERMVTIVGGNSERMNRDGVVHRKPKPDRAFKLRSRRRNFGNFNFSAPASFGVHWLALAILAITPQASQAAVDRKYYSLCSIGIQESGISSRSFAISSVIRYASELGNSGKKSPVWFYGSKPLGYYRIYQNDLRFPCAAGRALALAVRHANKSPRLPVGLLPVLGGSIVIGATFAKSRARLASKTGLRRTGLFDRQTSQSLLEALLLGLAATILLSLGEVSFRLLLQ